MEASYVQRVKGQLHCDIITDQKSWLLFNTTSQEQQCDCCVDSCNIHAVVLVTTVQ